MILEFLVKEQTIEMLPTKSIPRRGSRKYLTLRFAMSEDWNGMLSTAFLQYEGEDDSASEPIPIPENGEIRVPDYFAAKPYFQIHVVGINGDVSIPTNTITVSLEVSGEAWTEVPVGPNAPDYQNLINLVMKAMLSNKSIKAFQDALEQYTAADIVGLPVVDADSESGYRNMQLYLTENESEDNSLITVPTVGYACEMLRDAICTGYVDVTKEYEAALAAGQVKGAREYLWTLGAGRYCLAYDLGWLYLEAFAGEDYGKGPEIGRVLYAMGEFLVINVYGNCQFDDQPVFQFDSETGEIWHRDEEILSGVVKSVNGQGPDEKGNVEIEIPEGSVAQEYEKVTKVDIRHLMETGCYLLTSTGLPSNKTALLVDAGYAKIPVSPGERYRITTYIPNSSGIIFYGGDGSKVAVDEGGQAGGNITVTDYEVTVPAGCAVMGVSTRKRTRNPIIVKLVETVPMTPQVIGDSLTEMDRDCATIAENDDDRLYALESRIDFSFNADKGKVIFMTDGTRPILTDVYAIFKAHGMPLSVAPVYNATVTYAEPMNDNSTALEFLHMVEDDGGEIFAHSLNGDILTADTAEKMLRESKEWLTGEGFDVHGWIAPQGVFCPEARRLYAKYYRYGYKASDRTGSPLNFERPYLSTLGLDGAKAAIDDCEADKSVIVLFHHWSDNETEGFNLEDLEALLSYIESKDVDVTTYWECFFNYGSLGNDEGNSSGGSGIEVSGAKVGQFLKVKAVDENGVPTVWETVDAPVGGSAEFRHIRTVTIPDDVTTDTSGVTFVVKELNDCTFGFDTDEDGNPFDLHELLIFSNASTSHTSSSFALHIDSNLGGYGISGSSISTQITIGTSGAKKDSFSVSVVSLDGTSISWGSSFAGGGKNTVVSGAKPFKFAVDKISRISCFMPNLGVYGFSAGSKFEFYGR